MTLTLDSNHQRFGALNFDHVPSYPPSTTSPQFNNPWTSTASAPGASHGLYVNQGLNPNVGLDGMSKQQGARASSNSSASSLNSFASLPVPSAPAGSPHLAETFGQQDLLNMSQDHLLSLSRLQTTGPSYGDATYATAPSPVHTSYQAAQAVPYDTMGYAAAPIRSTFALAPDTEHRRVSLPSVPTSSPADLPDMAVRPSRNSLIDIHHRGLQADDRRSFADALDASHGMLAMSQETPRNIYGARSDRSSTDSYGFPSTHSTSSSISSTGNFSSYYPDSVSEYSTAGSDIESVASRTLPRPQGLMSSQVPPAPQSMMSQFSSKVSSSTQKKHKCKVCDKRFTRPSSLQTHMYSHTGEKPFACEVEGCGRHFSVVSNLRRHRKVHKGDARSEAGSEEHHSD